MFLNVLFYVENRCTYFGPENVNLGMPKDKKISSHVQQL